MTLLESRALELAWEVRWEQELELEAIMLCLLESQDKADSKGQQGHREGCSLGRLAAG